MSDPVLPDSTPLVRSLDSLPIMPKKYFSVKAPRLFIRFLSLAGVFLVIIGIALYFTVIRPVQSLIASAGQLEASAMVIPQTLKAQDLAATQKQLEIVSSDLDKTQKEFSRLSWTRVLPFARNYYLDGQRIFSAAREILAAANAGIKETISANMNFPQDPAPISVILYENINKVTDTPTINMVNTPLLVASIISLSDRVSTILSPYAHTN